MFTGLIEATGRISDVTPRGGGRLLRIETPMAHELMLGDSVAVNGVCLTVIRQDDTSCDFEVSPETLRVTSLGGFAAGRRVNLERPLRADARLGGHFVLGHVDAMGRIAAIRDDGDYRWIDIEYPSTMAPHLITKGSVAVDGISLTVAGLGDDRFGVQIVPFTWTHTALSDARAGDAVNLEGDVIGKYVARIAAISLTPAAR